jgi:hypothetical protein
MPPRHTYDLDAEAAKRVLAERRPDIFYLKDARSPDATYKKLFYQCQGGGASSTPIKVDILFPGGELDLPHIDHPVVMNGLPLVPFSVLLLHKLQGWDHNRRSPLVYKRKKTYQDYTDVVSLLKLSKRIEKLVQKLPWDNRSLFSESFMQKSRLRIVQFCADRRAPEDMRVYWNRLGLMNLDKSVYTTYSGEQWV